MKSTLFMPSIYIITENRLHGLTSGFRKVEMKLEISHKELYHELRIIPI